MIKGGKSSNLNLINSLKEKVFLFKKANIFYANANYF